MGDAPTSTGESSEVMSTSQRPFIKRFTTEEGHYVYDVNSNRILRVSPAMHAIVEDYRTESRESLVARHADGFPEGEIADAYEKLQNLGGEGLFSDSRPKEMGTGLCDKHFNHRLDTSLGQLVLEVTNACNLRCRYCAFGGFYDFTRGHGNDRMSVATARKAIDYFIPHSAKADHRSVGFYGGEPLLNMELIAECVRHIREQAPDEGILIHMTTNATLLTEDVARFIIDHDVGILVSIDGPKEVHDRHRVFANNEGTFDTVVTNLKRLREMDPEWYAQRVSTTCVITESSGSHRPFEFFASEEMEDLRGLFTMVSSVDPVNLVNNCLPCPDTDAFDEEQELYELFLNRLINNEFGPRTDDFLKSNFQQPFLRLYKREEKQLGDRVSVNGMCVPGWRKVFVDVDGNMHACERTNRSFPIGHVDTGLDRAAARSVLQCQVDANQDRCLGCWAVRLCGACLASINGEGCIDEQARNRFCEGEIRSWERSLAHYCGILELNPTALDYMEDVVVS